MAACIFSRFRLHLKSSLHQHVRFLIPRIQWSFYSVLFRAQPRYISYTKAEAEQYVHPSMHRYFKVSAILFDSPSKCWHCGSVVDEKPKMFCDKCQALQPPDKNVSYFKLFGIDDSFEVDVNQLSKKYKELQWSLHPDKFTSKPKEEQEYSEVYSALVNHAYRTLLQPLSRGLYLLEIKGNPFCDGDVLMDQEFLSEMMEVNENINSASTPEAIKILAFKNQETMEEAIKKLAASFKTDNWDSIKLNLAKLRYFTNIDDKIKEALLKSYL